MPTQANLYTVLTLGIGFIGLIEIYNIILYVEKCIAIEDDDYDIDDNVEPP
jgi:hypothetical protein